MAEACERLDEQDRENNDRVAVIEVSAIPMHTTTFVPPR